MKTNYLVEALLRLRPNSSFAFDNNDYSTIEWGILEGEAPTQKEIDDAIKAIKAEEKAEAKIKEEAKASAQAKLAALGLTVEDLTALGL